MTCAGVDPDEREPNIVVLNASMMKVQTSTRALLNSRRVMGAASSAGFIVASWRAGRHVAGGSPCETAGRLVGRFTLQTAQGRADGDTPVRSGRTSRSTS